MLTHSRKPERFYYSLLRIAAVVLIVFALLPASLVQAQDDDPPTSLTPPVGATEPALGSVTLVLNMAEAVTPDKVPTGLDSAHARQYARDLMAQYAQPVRDAMEQLIAHKKISNYEYDTRNGTIQVFGLTGTLDLNSLPDTVRSRINSMVPEGKPAPECAVETVNALPDWVRTISLIHTQSEAADQETIDLAQGISPTDPTGKIEVYMFGTYESAVRGKVSPNALVRLTVKRGAAVVTTQTTTSSTDGYYYFTSRYQSCPSTGYNWYLKPGDVVSIVAGGVGYSTIATSMTAWVDPITNSVSGKGLPNRQVRIILMQPTWSNPCKWVGTLRATTISGTGAFSSVFGDFDGRAWALVHVLDAAGNSTFTSMDAVHLYAYQDDPNYIYASIRQNVSLTIKHYRGATLLKTINFVPDMPANYGLMLSSPMQAKDVFTMTGTGVNVNFTVPAFIRVSVNPSTNKVTGFTLPGRKVAVALNRSYNSFRTTCYGGSFACGFTTSTTNGYFDVPLGVDILPADYAYMSIYDTAGNEFMPGILTTNALAINRSFNNVRGTWANRSATLTLKHLRAGVLLSTNTFYPSSYDGYYTFYYSYSELLKAGDVILITDNVSSLQTTVKNVTMRAKYGTNSVAGSGPAGKMVISVDDLKPATATWDYYCTEAANTGSYNVAFPTTFSGRDMQQLSILDAAGYYHLVFGGTFSMSATVNSYGVWGYTELPSAITSVVHKRGGVVIGSYSGLSDLDSWFGVNLNTAVLPGDTFILNNNPATLTVPKLTVAKDTALNRIYGGTVPNRPVNIWLDRFYHQNYYSYWLGGTTQANSSGAYSFNLNGLYFNYMCKPAKAGEYCARAEVDYYTPQGFGVFNYTPWPNPVTADAYENDNYASAAKTYSAAQKHSLVKSADGSSDVDWVGVYIYSTDLNKPITFKLTGLGWYMDVRTALYAPDGSTWLAEATLNEYNTPSSNMMTYTFTKAGKYFLKFYGPDNYSYGACDSYYTLTVIK